MSDRDADRHVDRRTLLRTLSTAGAASLAGCSAFRGGDADGGGATAARTDEGTPPATPVEPDRAREFAERFAPVLYFDADERWFPTDPRPYASERDGERVVDGFDAFDGYAERFEAAGPDDPPDPTVFYHAVEYDDSPLAVVQFWLYSAFDQFTTNFHWHDWEVVHVFVDTETGEPQLYVASAHSRKVPNNEHLDPSPEAVPRVLSELGSHSSALSLNEEHESFQRLDRDGLAADITNRALDGLASLAEIPVAYGLPRDEGARLPYLVPELDGEPIYEHPDLPSVSRSSLVPEALTVRSFDGLSAPPDSLPPRETGVVFDLAGRATDRTDPDVEYELVPATAVEDIAAFTGPPLSFEFAVPKFAEDAVASHITTASTPWTQPRYRDPAADITEPTHRAALAERYDVVSGPGGIDSVVAAVTRAVESDEAPDGEGLTTIASPVETVALLESAPEAVPTFRGMAVVRDVPAGEHRLTVNGAGYAPHSEAVSVAGDGSATAAGVEGQIPLVDAADAVKLEVDATGADAELTALAVEDDFAGRLYDAPMDGPDAVYVHRGGAYTTEVRDVDDALGAFRVTPAGGGTVTIDRPRTGKGSLASFVADISTETRDQVAAAAPGRTGDAKGGDGGGGDAVRGLVRALDAAIDNVERAAERADEGDRKGANRALETARDSLVRAVDRLDDARDALPEPLARAAKRRFDQAERRAEQALDAEKL
jgi:hypothetical protein